ncbi:MAG TPA: hypothetical protein VFG54_12255 [Prolixibacteraceae bacterium]|nr:hypothetical protein [Prolixibacteraceae bacterium]
MKKSYVQTNVNMQAKNSAWRSLQEFAHAQNGTLIHGDDTLNEFVDWVEAKVEQVNKQHPRCQDLTFKKQTGTHLSVYATVHPDHAFSMTFLPIHRELSQEGS